MSKDIKKIKILNLFNIDKGNLQSLKSIDGKYTFITASEEWKTHNTFTHDCEALVFAMGAGGSLGRTHYIKGKFIASDLCFILTTKKNGKYPVNLKFYQLYLNHIRKELVTELAMGAAKKAINKKNFSDYEVIYIPIKIQNEISKKGIELMNSRKEIEIISDNLKANCELLLKKIIYDVF